MITTSTPRDWRELQTQVARILEECGLTVEIEKTVKTARGEVELDVYAEETVQGRRYSIVCECKHWSARIPQNVIHGFRTVISDIGANIGYIVSLQGFQSGAFKASELTNIDLVTWEGFQSAFEQSWLKQYFSPHLAERLDPLISYTEPFYPKWFEDLPEEKKEQFIELKDRYDEFGWLILNMTPIGVQTLKDKAIPTLPLIDQLPSDSNMARKIPHEILKEKGYREFLESLITFGEQAISQFRALRPSD